MSMNCIGISPNASSIAAGFADSSLKLWQLDSNSQAAEQQQQQRGTHWCDTPATVFSANTRSMIAHSGPVYSCSFSPDNQYVLSCSEDCSARLWSLQTRSDLVVYKGHNFPVWDVQFAPVGYYFATASHDRTARLWSTDHICPLRIFAGHLSDVDCVKFHPNCNYVATGSSDKTLRLWDVQTGSSVRILSGHTAAVHALDFSPDGRILASADERGNIITFDLATSKRLNTLTGHTRAVTSLQFSRCGSLLASAGMDQTVRIWDVEKVRGKSGTSDNPTAATGEAETNIDPSPSDPHLLSTWRTKNTPVIALRFNRSNLLFAAGPFNPPE